MDKLSSINQNEGLLVKSTSEVILSLPYDIFSLESTSLPIYTTGWFLAGSQFKTEASDISSKISGSNITLVYLLRSNTKWEVYAPLNNSAVDDLLPRIDTIEPMDSFWIYMK